MVQKLEYKVVHGVGQNADVGIATCSLSLSVNECLAEGWIPTGGVSIVSIGSAQAPVFLASQAVTRDKVAWGLSRRFSGSGRVDVSDAKQDLK